MSALTPKADINRRHSHFRFGPNLMSAIPRKRTLVSAFFGNLGAASLIVGCAGSPYTSNKITPKGLASWRRQSGSVPSSECWLRSGILPRRLLCRGGALVVAAMVAAQLREIPMTTAKPKHKPASRANDSKTKTRNSVKRATAGKARQLKPVTKPVAHQQPQSAPQPTARYQSKKAHIIAMLRAPGGATIEAMARAAKWQPHSVRGFLAGVVRKKLDLTLVSADGENGRVYRITDRTALAVACAMRPNTTGCEGGNQTFAGRRDRASARSRSPWLADTLEEHVSATAAFSSASASAVCRPRLSAPGR
jgi:Protein of unknown function (DUF3489)